MSIKTGLEYVGHIDPWTDEERLTDEEIVRCRDCRYASAGEAVISGNWQYGNCHNPRFRWSVHCANARADGFCAWGVRRDA